MDNTIFNHKHKRHFTALRSLTDAEFTVNYINIIDYEI
jgi:hypothetical protein